MLELAFLMFQFVSGSLLLFGNVPKVYDVLILLGKLFEIYKRSVLIREGDWPPTLEVCDLLAAFQVQEK